VACDGPTDVRTDTELYVIAYSAHSVARIGHVIMTMPILWWFVVPGARSSTCDCQPMYWTWSLYLLMFK